jgi:polar amino acid transport system substrate-binding protein
VNAIITDLKNEGFLAATHEKWFGTAPEDTTSTVQVMDVPTP